MKASTALAKATRLLQQMERVLEPFNQRLAELLGEDRAHLVYQPSDGWCFVFDDDRNAPTAFVDIDRLLTMERADALAYLRANSV